MTNLFNQEVIFTRCEHSDNAHYYEVRIKQDLLGDIVLCKVWGNKHSRLGGRSQEICHSYEAALKQLTELHQRRLKHGYRLRDCCELIFQQVIKSKFFNHIKMTAKFCMNLPFLSLF